jgi:hypothetical protein
MQVYYTTTEDRARTILLEGFADMYEFGGREGVWLSDCQLDANDGFDGPVTLCIDVPDEEFTKYEFVEEGRGHRISLMPAHVLNRIGKPEVYDHEYLGNSRAEMVQSIREWESGEEGSDDPLAKELRSAMKFFDDIGWLTPVKLRQTAK